MLIELKKIKYYFLTNNNPIRKQHILNEFKEYDINEINPNHSLNNSKYKSACSGFLKILDIAIKEQDKNKPFQPFVILEDDVKKYREFPENLEIPHDSDILYIGLSQCGWIKNNWSNDVYYENINNEIIKIYNMLSSHSFIICSLTGLLAFQKSIIEGFFKDEPWDIYMTYIQNYYNVYALRKPLVYQYAAIGGHEVPTKIEYNNFNNLPHDDLWIEKTNITFLTKSE